MTEGTYAKGLAGVIAAESTICKIDGEQGFLRYRGIDIRELAENSNFPEAAFLLLRGRLPRADELSAFDEALRGYRQIAPALVSVLRALPSDTHPMIALQAVVAAHGGLDEPVPAGFDEPNFVRATKLIARFPTFVAAWDRIRRGLEPVETRSDLGHGQNFLYMLDGQEPDAEIGRIFDVCLVLHMEHSFNASTFTARVAASTEAPMDTAVSAAVGALYGPLHGGANERVLAMLDTVPSVDEAEAWALRMLADKQKIMGMGHRVYKAKDPRSLVLEGFLSTLVASSGESDAYDKLKAIERVVVAEFQARGKAIYPNVDYFSGALYQNLGIAPEQFTPIFAVARIVGWCAHILEQWSDNRIFRPRALYNGPETAQWIPVAAR